MRFHWTRVILQWGVHNLTPLSWEPWVAASDTLTIMVTNFWSENSPNFGSKVIGLVKCILLIVPCPHAHCKQTVVYGTVCVTIPCSNKLSFSGTKANLDLVHIRRDTLGGGSKGTLVFCLRRCNYCAEVMGSVLGHRGAFRGSMGKISYKMTSGEKCKERRK